MPNRFTLVGEFLVVSACRGTLVQLDGQLSSLEVSLPLSIAKLDEQIGMPIAMILIDINFALFK